MLVADLEELKSTNINFVKEKLFLNISEEEATVRFHNVIDVARKQWYRPIDNLFHVISDHRKEKVQRNMEEQAKKARRSKMQKKK